MSRISVIGRHAFKQPTVTRLQKDWTPRMFSIQYFKARRHQSAHGVLRQKGKDVMLVLPPALRWPHWRAGQRVWFQMRGPSVAITRRPTGPRGRQRHSSRVRRAHVSLMRARAERLSHEAEGASRLSKFTR